MPDDGKITALAAQDGTLFVFKRRAIYAVAGEPYSDNASSGGFSAPRKLAVDIGCIEPRSILVTSLGIFFQSERGIELLTRSQSVQWIGERIKDTVNAFPVVTGVTLENTANSIYFELAASESASVVGGSGRTAIFDMTMGAWVSFDRRASASGTADTPAQSGALVWSGSAWRYAWLGTNGTVYVENHSSYLDANSGWVTMRWETPWVKLGLQQAQRIWTAMLLVGTGTSAGLLVERAADYADYQIVDQVPISEDVTAQGVQFDVLPNGLGTAMKFRISDSAPRTPGTGAGFVFVGLSFDITPQQGPSKGTSRLSPATRGG